MTRYFYSNPLAAAWMRLHFDMKFEQDVRVNFSALAEGSLFFNNYCSDGNEESPYPDKHYIHPDSLPLLEPRVGDLIYITESKIGTLARLHDGNLKLFTGDWLMKPDHVSIIRRDGKPFFWPESEEE
jgi:hypothetical protein